MTDVEKVARAIASVATPVNWASLHPAAKKRFLDQARAALKVMRESEQQAA